MRPTVKVQNALRGLLQRYGTETMKEWLWNYEYRRGRWNCLDTMSGDGVYPYVEKYARHGSILDLGCGPGAVGNELDASTYQSYTGVDISDVAISKARQRTATNHRSHKNEYLQSDIFTYVPERQYNVILFGDSIYYFPHQQIAEMLGRYATYLEQDGVFIVRSWILKERHQAIIRNLEENFAVLEKHLYHDGQIVVITFRPSTSVR